ncbi:hypothetical protein TWF788_005476 [Orbilia oligospora]|uniref:Uncharacterized protein n=1 Tax=Orbilia oligospora TaxID=2813651 RepID=A0A6G1LYJ8_ORBOL|nr:hypothetical protein TWF788_005476 [Orbilia oligospora]KAF3209050.1 hypothetical protein TWF679_007567 [Orbilia oligospora]KAF3225959.1 hypothetical protein TWF191_004985 [Orbilia oligospora]KAF3237779.1 hypothetical protein TWF192_010782 [Orbilia oligospora]
MTTSDSPNMPHHQQEEYRNRFVGKILLDASRTSAGQGEVLRSQLPRNHQVVRMGSHTPQDFDGWRMTLLIDDDNLIRRIDFY